ncbi:beta strand repeat-containing protein [Clostridium sp. WILCCON 0269]|uniref:Beta strand repeat-containing protein n=1 Tax=Candidatus Clostridium eludens TaxID=3381663 RepID=A0ABW8SEP2_9CLOT
MTRFKRDKNRMVLGLVSAINGTVTVTVTLSAAPTTAPAISDFAVTQSIGGATATTVTPTAINTNGNVVTLTVPTVAASTSADQSVVDSVSYQGGTAVIASAFTVSKAGALAVSSASAINATQMKVVFSSAVASGVGANGAENTANYAVGGTPPTTAVLQSDGKTVVLTFAAATTLTGVANAGTDQAVVDVEPIASATDNTALTPRYVSTLTYKDTVAPTVTSITASTKTAVATSFTVNFSEPIGSLGSVKVDGTGVVGVLAADHLSANFVTDLDATKAHSVQFVGLADIVGNIATTFGQSFNVTVDNAAPVATLAPSADVDNAFTLTFDKDVTPATVTAAALNIVDSNNSAATFGVPVITQPDLNNDKVYLVTSPNNIFATKTTQTFSVALPTTIQDSLGNSLAAVTKSVTLTKDTTKPAITGVKVVKDGAGNVTSIVLSSDSALSAASLANLSVVDSDGVLCTGTTALGVLNLSPVAPGDKVVTITPTNSVPLTGKYTFTFAAGTLTDEAVTPNNSVAYSTVVDFGTATSTGTFTITPGNVAKSSDTSAPVATLNALLQPVITNNVYTINFGTTVVGGTAAGSAINAADYTINGNALPTGTTVTLNPAKDTATITIPAGTIATTDDAAVLYISGVKDTAGDTVVPVTTTVQLNDNVAPVIKTATLNSDYTITVGTGETLAGAPVYGTDYAVYLDGVQVGGLGISAGVGSDTGKYVITGLTKAQYNAATSVTVKSLVGATVTDVAGNPLTAGTTLTIK